MKYEYGKIVKQLDVCRVVTFSFVVGVLVCFLGGGVDSVLVGFFLNHEHASKGFT